ncbi:MAG: AMP-binding protein, partial [Saprospiraceae bacterium]|nr:AMP-binding protein [Saprospiraceae bacterium]
MPTDGNYIPTTVPSAFRRMAEQMGTKTAFRHKDYGLWHDTSWYDYYRQARHLAQALMYFGLEKGDFVAIIGENAPEWVIADMGIQLAGGVSVGIYSTSSWEQVGYVLDHSESRFLFAENEEQVDKWLRLRESGSRIEKVAYWDDKGLLELDEPTLLSFEQLLELGREADERDPDRLDRRTVQVDPEDPAILVYTSGTTGPPKGAMLSHGNLTWMGHTVGLIDPGFTVRPDDEVMSFLPLCHIFERIFSVCTHISYGYTLNFVESPDTVPHNLREISPTIGYAVPRIWEKFHSRIIIQMDDAKPLKRLAFYTALKIGMKHAAYTIEDRQPPWWLALANRLAHYGVFHWVRRRLGMERMRFALSGAAPISPDVLRFFHAI